MLCVCLAATFVATASASESHPFPHYSNSFSFGQKIYVNSEPTPSVFLTYAWDDSAGRSMYTANISNPKPTEPSFELQLRRCDEGKMWDVKQDATGQYTCTLPSPSCPMSQFWIYPAPGAATWNGTDTINGVECDRFDIKSPMGRQTFWGSPTTPCRTITDAGPSDLRQSDYVNWIPMAPPASAYEPPAYVAGLTCKPVPESAKPIEGPWLQ
jgi:hypothetical protein